MILTLNVINTICPNHSRTSCDDQHHENGHYEIKELIAPNRQIVFERLFEYGPDCKRCMLLDWIGIDTEELKTKHHIEIIPTIEIRLVQPKLRITVEE
jgi:hypothetical protein